MASLPPAAEAHARFLQTRSFGSLDGLRGLSIIAVLWHHTHLGFPGWPISRRGFLGVDLFFVISGFLIVTLLLRERHRTGAISLRSFYARRFLRIFPAYYAMLALVAVVAFAFPGNSSAEIRRDLPYALFYVSNMVPMLSMLGITWSLSTEEQFYLVIPTLEKYARGAMPVILVTGYVLLSLPPFGVLPGVDMPPFFRQTTFGPILLGVMLAHVMHDPRGYAWVWRVLGSPWSPLAAGALTLLAVSIPGEDISGWIRIAIHASFVVLVASCVAQERQALRPMLSFRPLARVGLVSYGIYLYHLIAAHGVNKVLARLDVTSQLVHFVVVSLAAWGVAELSYRLFETRFLALKDRFDPARSRAKKAASANPHHATAAPPTPAYEVARGPASPPA
jgi:peptidoglycan/LPS O-acetylase OafA/YrhL